MFTTISKQQKMRAGICVIMYSIAPDEFAECTPLQMLRLMTVSMMHSSRIVKGSTYLDVCSSPHIRGKHVRAEAGCSKLEGVQRLLE